MNGNPATIIKDGKLTIVDEVNLHPGDLIFVQAGDIVPADIRLTEATGLEVDEFEIKGELLPVFKKMGADDEFLYMGSKVTNGSGRGIVIRVGKNTEFGRILTQKWERNKKILVKLIQKRYFGLVGLIFPPLLFHLLQGNSNFLLLPLTGLISFFLIILQNDQLFYYFVVMHEVKKLQRIKIEVRDPKQLELLHQTDTVFFDKTGVLTTRKINIGNLYFIDLKHNSMVTAAQNNEFNTLVFTACALCNDVHYQEKLKLANQIDQALINFAFEKGVDLPEITSQYKRIAELPFDSENRYMASGFSHNRNEFFYFTKGDPEVVMEMCDGYIIADGSYHKKDFNFLNIIGSQVENITNLGKSVIALAYNCSPHKKKPIKYSFLCLIELENALHPDASKIIREISTQNRRSILVSGDKANSVLRVAKECGIIHDSKACLTGKIINNMDLAEVSRQSSYCSVFAQLTPSQKGVLAYLFQLKGHRVTMIGDGPNDGVALKVANISISFVENSSPVARNLSKILIKDLADILILFKKANNIHRGLALLKAIRILAIVMLLAGFYIFLVF